MKNGLRPSLLLLILSFTTLQGISQSATGTLNLSGPRPLVNSTEGITILKPPVSISLLGDPTPVTDRFKLDHTDVLSDRNRLNSGPSIFSDQELNFTEMGTSLLKSDRNHKNRRNIYSSLWAYASLNYLYADIVQFMDKGEHLKYHTGMVNGWEMAPGFLAGSAAFMQVAIANLFLPQVIKDERKLRWVQIASGTVMTLVQSATLFAGKPTPYYATFSAFEIAATLYITIDAIRWKPSRPLQ